MIISWVTPVYMSGVSNLVMEMKEWNLGTYDSYSDRNDDNNNNDNGNDNKNN